MPFVRRFRIPALSCAFALLFCELVSRPFAEIGICDDWSYIISAHRLAATGHIAYIGWAAAMLGWQLYIGALFIKLAGFSDSTVRMATVLVAMASAFLLQRSMVRARISERNATIATLAFVLSPLCLELSVTFMSDVYGLFAIVLCLYACLRALQASTPNRTIAWLCFAAASNAVGGSARQIAWLGVLVMVPSTLWLLRSQRRVLLAGIPANIAGAIFVFACMRWFRHQPHATPSLPASLFAISFPLLHMLRQFAFVFLDIPLLLLPLFGLFLPQLRKASRRVIVALSVVALFYASRVFYYRQFKLNRMLEPIQGDWVSASGIYGGTFLQGAPPLFLHPWAQILLTIVSLGGLLGLIATLTLLRTTPRPSAVPKNSPASLTGQQLAILLGPFTLAYIVLLIPQATVALFDRYMLGLLVVLTICLVRYYQDRIQPSLPTAAIGLVAIMAMMGVTMTHNMFSFYRARVALAAELSASGVPPTSVDAGWESSMATETKYADSLPQGNYDRTPRPPGSCQMFWYYLSPHVHPIYSVSFDPNACAGPTSFAPVQYSRWLAPPGTLYAVKFTPAAP